MSLGFLWQRLSSLYTKSAFKFKDSVCTLLLSVWMNIQTWINFARRRHLLLSELLAGCRDGCTYHDSIQASTHRYPYRSRLRTCSNRNIELRYPSWRGLWLQLSSLVELAVRHRLVLARSLWLILRALNTSANTRNRSVKTIFQANHSGSQQFWPRPAIKSLSDYLPSVVRRVNWPDSMRSTLPTIATSYPAIWASFSPFTKGCGCFAIWSSTSVIVTYFFLRYYYN